MTASSSRWRNTSIFHWSLQTSRFLMNFRIRLYPSNHTVERCRIGQETVPDPENHRFGRTPPFDASRCRHRVPAIPAGIPRRGQRRPLRGLRGRRDRLQRVPGVPRAVLPALVHLLPRAGDAGVHPEAREGEAHGAGGGSRGRGAALPGRHRRGDRTGRRARPEGGADVPDRLRRGREECLLLPHPPGERPPAGSARRLRRAEEGVVPDHRQPPPPLFRQRGVPPLDGPALHLQYLVPWLPREPGVHQLRPVDGQLPHHLDGAGDQLRDVPQPRGRARAGGPGDPEGGTAHGPEDHRHQDVHRGAAQLHLRPVPREDVPRLPGLHAGGAVLRPFRPHDPGGPGLLPGRP